MNPHATIDPIKLAVRFEPPQLALVYLKGKETLLHEFPLSTEDLDNEAAIVLDRLKKVHPGYLDEVRGEQVIRLVEMIQQHQAREEQDFRSKLEDLRANPNHRRMGNFKGFFGEEDFSSQGEEMDDMELGDQPEQIDFMAIEKDMSNDSYNDSEEEPL